jgi:hypothetical protein
LPEPAHLGGQLLAVEPAQVVVKVAVQGQAGHKGDGRKERVAWAAGPSGPVGIQRRAR